MLNGVKSSDLIEVQKLMIENYNNSVLSMNGNTTSIDSRACAKPDRKVNDNSTKTVISSVAKYCELSLK